MTSKCKSISSFELQVYIPTKQLGKNIRKKINFCLGKKNNSSTVPNSLSKRYPPSTDKDIEVESSTERKKKEVDKCKFEQMPKMGTRYNVTYAYTNFIEQLEGNVNQRIERGCNHAGVEIRSPFHRYLSRTPHSHS